MPKTIFNIFVANDLASSPSCCPPAIHALKDSWHYHELFPANNWLATCNINNWTKLTWTFCSKKRLQSHIQQVQDCSSRHTSETAPSHTQTHTTLWTLPASSCSSLDC